MTNIYIVSASSTTANNYSVRNIVTYVREDGMSYVSHASGFGASPPCDSEMEAIEALFAMNSYNNVEIGDC